MSTPQQKRSYRRQPIEGFPKHDKFVGREEAEVYCQSDRKVCLICGRPYRSLGWHLNSIHEVSQDKYRAMFGIPEDLQVSTGPWRDRFPIKEGLRICTTCLRELPVESFHKSRHSKSGRLPECHDCKLAYSRDRYKENREDILRRHRAHNKSEHRRSWARNYAAIRLRTESERAAGRPKPEACGICGKSGTAKGIVFDHDHATGKFRGWICGLCNTAIGLSGDSPAILRAMARYLETSREGTERVA